MFKLQCECGNRIAVRSKYAGKTIHCIKCKREIKVPDASASMQMIGVPRASVDARVLNAGPARQSDQPAAHRADVLASPPLAASATRRAAPSQPPSLPPATARSDLMTRMAAPADSAASPPIETGAVGGALRFAPLFPVESPKPASPAPEPQQGDQPIPSAASAAPANEQHAADSHREAPAGLFDIEDEQIRNAAADAGSSELNEQAGADGGRRGQAMSAAATVHSDATKRPASMSWFDLPDDEPSVPPSESRPVEPQTKPTEAVVATPAVDKADRLNAKVERKPAPAPAPSDAAPARLHLDGYLHQAAIDRRHRRTRRLMLTVRLMVAAAVIVAVVVGVTLVAKTLLRARAGSADAVTFVLVNQAVAGSRATSLTVHLAFPGLEHDSYALLEGDLDALAKAVPPLVIRHRIHHATVPSSGTSVIEDAQGRKRLNKVRYDLTPDEAATLWEVPSATCVIGTMRFEMTPQTVHQMHWQAERYGYDIASPAE